MGRWAQHHRRGSDRPHGRPSGLLPPIPDSAWSFTAIPETETLVCTPLDFDPGWSFWEVYLYKNEELFDGNTNAGDSTIEFPEAFNTSDEWEAKARIVDNLGLARSDWSSFKIVTVP